MSNLTPELTRRELLLAGASVAAVITTGSDLKAADVAASSKERFAVAIQPSKGDPVQPRIFGGDLEPIARCIYGGVWDRERNIPRADVKAAMGNLGVTAIRWPGSSSASAYHWRDGVGPIEKRPSYDVTFWSEYGKLLVKHISDPVEKEKLLKKIDTGQPNQFGTDEFLQYCLDLGIEPVVSVNVGGRNTRSTGTPEEAAAWVRYCNVDRKSPRPVQWWQLGNEVWSPGDLDHQSPKDYAHRVIELATAMRREDPSIKLICVASGLYPSDWRNSSKIFPDIEIWNREVFAITAPYINAASYTRHYPGSIGRWRRTDAADALQMATGSDAFGVGFDRVLADLDAVGGAAAKVPIYVGEWGIQDKAPDIAFSDNHTLSDGVYFAGCFNRMIERSRRVLGAHLSTLVNHAAPIQTEGDRFFVTACYLVMQMYRFSCRQEQAPVDVKTDTMLVPAMRDAENAAYLIEMARTDRQAPILDAVATVDRSGTTLYLTNRSLTEAITVDVSGIKPLDGQARFRYVAGDSPYACNTLDAPNTLKIAEFGVTVKAGRARVTVPPCTAGALIAGPREGALIST